MQESVRGIIDHIIFRNEDNGYTVLVLRDKGKELTCVGFFQSVNEGESIEAFGHRTSHASYGDQFRVERYEVREPEGEEAIAVFIESLPTVKSVSIPISARCFPTP